MMRTIEIILPLPPTTNKLWSPVATRGGARMVKRDAYRTWTSEAIREVVMQRGDDCIAGQFRAAILLPEGRFDGDNLIKPLLDACQHGGAIRNDRDCIGGSWDIDDTRHGTALVVLTEIPPQGGAPLRTKGNARKGKSRD